MQSQPQPGGPDPPSRHGEEARLMLDRAERAWQQQVANEETQAAATGPRATLRWLLVALVIGAIVFLMFQRLAELG